MDDMPLWKSLALLFDWYGAACMTFGAMVGASIVLGFHGNVIAAAFTTLLTLIAMVLIPFAEDATKRGHKRYQRLVDPNS